MFTHYRTQGIFLKTEDRNEADRLFTLFSQDFGKLEVLARGIRKITSKLRSGADIFYFSEIEFIQGKTYKRLTDAILIERFANLQRSQERTNTAWKISQALNDLTFIEQKDEKIWSLLKESFYALERFSDFKMIQEYFLWNLFHFLGYSPDFYHCLGCQKPLLPETLFFSAREGGVLCWRCLQSFKEKLDVEEILVDTIKLIRIFQKEKIEILPKLHPELKTLENLKKISFGFLNFLRESLLSFQKTD